MPISPPELGSGAGMIATIHISHSWEIVLITVALVAMVFYTMARLTRQ